MAFNVKKDSIDFKIKGVGAIPNMISTKEELEEVEAMGSSVDALLIKNLNERLAYLENGGNSSISYEDGSLYITTK